MNVSFQKISKTFGDVTALRGVSLDVADGELFFLLGPSGCGKTTLLRCLGGFETPTEGRILLGGRDVTALPAHERNTAMVFQGYALWPHMSVRENVVFGLDAAHVPAKEKQARVKKALQAVQISELADRKPGELSGGQQQRVALARTLVVEPGCLLLDEPLANLDAKLRRDMRAEIRRICKENGLTAVYVTHDRQEALSMADRIAVMQDGVVLQLGTPAEIYSTPCNAFVASFMGECNFVEGTVHRSEGDLCVVDTLFGDLGSSVASGDFATEQPVLLSIRPEAIRRGRDLQNNISGVVEHITYMGEMSEYVLRIHEGLSLRMYELNSRDPVRVGDRIDVNISPEEVVVLREDAARPLAATK